MITVSSGLATVAAVASTDSTVSDDYDGAEPESAFPIEVDLDFSQATTGERDADVDCSLKGPTLWARIAPGSAGSVLAEVDAEVDISSMAVVRELDDGGFDTRVCGRATEESHPISTHTVRFRATGYALVIEASSSDARGKLTIETRDPVKISWGYGDSSYATLSDGHAFLEIAAICEGDPILEFAGTGTQRLGGQRLAWGAGRSSWSCADGNNTWFLHLSPRYGRYLPGEADVRVEMRSCLDDFCIGWTLPGTIHLGADAGVGHPFFTGASEQ